MTSALVTGASGFIGAALCHALKSKGLKVIGATRQGSSLDKGIKTLPITDMRDKDVWKKGRLQGVDVIYHLAGLAHAVRGGKYDQRVLAEAQLSSINVAATMILVEEAERAGVRRLVYVSSIKAVGEESEACPLSDKALPCPRDAYGRSKLEAETQLREFAKNASIEVTILRPPLVYGPGVKGNFYSLLRLAHSEIPLPLKGIHAKRSMIYVDNLTAALYLCGAHPKAKGEVFHVRDDEDMSIATLIERIRSSMGRPSRLFPFPSSVLSFAARVLHRQEAWSRLSAPLQVNDQKIRNVLGWRPMVSADKGIQQTVNWYLDIMARRRDHEERY